MFQPTKGGGPGRFVLRKGKTVALLDAKYRDLSEQTLPPIHAR